MRLPLTPNLPCVERVATGFLGTTLLASAAFSAALARDEIALRGVICGIGHISHCGWCYGAVSLGLAGLTAFAVAFQRSVEGAALPARTGRPPRP